MDTANHTRDNREAQLISVGCELDQIETNNVFVA